MGLDTSHDAWHGPYGAFSRWRNALATVAGYPSEERYEGVPMYVLDWDNLPTDADLLGTWTAEPDDPLLYLLAHSDCEGEIQPEHCTPLADRLEALLPLLPPDEGGPLSRFGARSRTEQFVAGLRDAASRGEPVDFH